MYIPMDGIGLKTIYTGKHIGLMVYPKKQIFEMEANELRIGNWISDRGGKEWQIDHWESEYKVASKAPFLYSDDVFFVVTGHPLTEDIHFLKPIPLTEEWLKRFGLERDGCKGIYAFQFLDMDINIHKSYNIWRLTFERVDRIMNIRSVHQLQNLYFALTGKELEWKESQYA